jgi:hypothetical protein
LSIYLLRWAAGFQTCIAEYFESRHQLSSRISDCQSKVRAGMRANALTALFGIELDRLRRPPVDDYLQVVGLPDVFAAGDVAAANGATFSLTSLRS